MTEGTSTRLPSQGQGITLFQVHTQVLGAELVHLRWCWTYHAKGVSIQSLQCGQEIWDERHDAMVEEMGDCK